MWWSFSVSGQLAQCISDVTFDSLESTCGSHNQEVDFKKKVGCERSYDENLARESDPCGAELVFINPSSSLWTRLIGQTNKQIRLVGPPTLRIGRSAPSLSLQIIVRRPSDVSSESAPRTDAFQYLASFKADQGQGDDCLWAPGPAWCPFCELPEQTEFSECDPAHRVGDVTWHVRERFPRHHQGRSAFVRH